MLKISYCVNKLIATLFLHGDMRYSRYKHYYDRGLQQLKAQNHTKALSSFKIALMYRNDFADLPAVYHHIGLTYHKSGKYMEAIASYDKLLELDSTNHEVVRSRGDSYLSLNQKHNAEEDYSRAFDHYYNRGIEQLESGEMSEAIQSFYNATLCKGSDAYSYYQIGSTLAHSGHYTPSLNYFNKAIELGLETSSVFSSRAELYELLGDTEKAKKDDIRAFSLLGKTEENRITELSKKAEDEFKTYFGCSAGIDSKGVFKTIIGVEKESFPTGTVRLKSKKGLKKGSNDSIKIPLYLGKDDAEGSITVFNEYLCCIAINGIKLPEDFLEGNYIAITIEANKQGNVLEIETRLPSINYSEKKQVMITSLSMSGNPVNFSKVLNDASVELISIYKQGFYTDKEELERLKLELEFFIKVFSGIKQSEMDITLCRRAKRTLRTVYRFTYIWEMLEENLKQGIKKTKKLIDGLGYENYKLEIENIESRFRGISTTKNIKSGENLEKELKELNQRIEKVMLTGYVERMKILSVIRFSKDSHFSEESFTGIFDELYEMDKLPDYTEETGKRLKEIEKLVLSEKKFRIPMNGRMSRYKVDYGIYLGANRSMIARVDYGGIRIIRSELNKEYIPSCVAFNKRKATLVGEKAVTQLEVERNLLVKSWEEDYNSYTEFKRTMGYDTKYYSSNMKRSYSSEELSAEVLKKLRSLVTDEDVYAAIITVPNRFGINQQDATRKAAYLAGFAYTELLLEPIAASIAYGLDAKNEGSWVVFNFGVSTFDASLVKIEEGVMRIIDTEGDPFLGGKNPDEEIVEKILIPYLSDNYVIDSILEDKNKRKIFSAALKRFAEELKIRMSFNEEYNLLTNMGDVPGEDDEGEEFEIDITVTQEELEEVLAPIFQRAIDQTKELLQRNNMPGEELDALILVGGPTYSPILRKMLKEQICEPDVSVDPVTAVVRGAAKYAANIDVPEEVWIGRFKHEKY